MKKLLILFSFLIFIFSCKEKPPVDENKFMFVYIDLISFPDSLHKKPEMLEEYKDIIFNHYGINREEYLKMIEYYNSKPELWDQFFQKAIKYVETKPDSAFLN